MQSWMGAGDVGASVLAGFTFILGFLVVFRSQQAFARWWEGGTLLQQLRGEWFNAYSSLMAFCNSAPDKQQDVLEFQHRLARLVSLLYCAAIQQVSTMKNKNYELIDIKDFNHDSLQFLMEAHDKCEVCLQWIQRLIGEANETQTIKVAPPILSRVYNQLGNGIVNLNNARKITEFPIPFPLAQMITFMLLFHWGITAFVCAASVQTTFWAGLISFVVVFSFWSINYIAVELEQPFGDDANDLPLNDMQEDLNKSLSQLMNIEAQQPPSFNFKREHQLLRKSTQGVEDIIKEDERIRNSRGLNGGISNVAPAEDLTGQQLAPPSSDVYIAFDSGGSQATAVATSSACIEATSLDDRSHKDNPQPMLHVTSTVDVDASMRENTGGASMRENTGGSFDWTRRCSGLGRTGQQLIAPRTEGGSSTSSQRAEHRHGNRWNCAPSLGTVRRPSCSRRAAKHVNTVVPPIANGPQIDTGATVTCTPSTRSTHSALDPMDTVCI